MTQSAPVTLEICVESPAGVAAAIAGGADRIELCSALEVGGLTPSAGLMAEAHRIAAAANVPVFAMVRPRPGDFHYDAQEIALAIRESQALIAAGADGLVFGACADDQIDVTVATTWIRAIRDANGGGLPCTFHRAIDLTEDPIAAAETAADLGFDRILTSGGAVRAIDGVDTIATMIARVGNRIAIMAGSGVSPDTVPSLAKAGVREFHASASRTAQELAPRVAALGFAAAPRRVTDADLVRTLRSAINATSS